MYYMNMPRTAPRRLSGVISTDASEARGVTESEVAPFSVVSLRSYAHVCAHTCISTRIALALTQVHKHHVHKLTRSTSTSTYLHTHTRAHAEAREAAKALAVMQRHTHTFAGAS